LRSSTWDKFDTVSRFVLSSLVLVFVFVALGTFSEIQEFESKLNESNCVLEEGNITDNRFYNESLDLPMPRQQRNSYSLNGVD